MRIHANGIAIEVEDSGPPNGEPLLMIMGLGMQLTAWPEPLLADLVGRGFRVLRMDNRDAGLTQSFDHLGLPNLLGATLRHAMGMAVPAPYTLADMAEDARGVLDAFNLPRAHVCAASMGGMVAQHLAARHPQRVKSLTLLMTTSGAPRLPQPSARVKRALIMHPGGRDLASAVKHLESVMRLIGSPAYPMPQEELHGLVKAAVRRGWHPTGNSRQLLAVAADGDRSALLKRISAPTHVLHGQADPLIPVAAAHDLAAKIANATLELIDGMGHDLPTPLLPRIAASIARNANRAASA